MIHPFINIGDNSNTNVREGQENGVYGDQTCNLGSEREFQHGTSFKLFCCNHNFGIFRFKHGKAMGLLDHWAGGGWRGGGHSQVVKVCAGQFRSF